MVSSKIKSLVLKVIGISCALALIVSVIYAPMSFGASAAAIPVTEDETVLFTFNPEDGSVTDVNDPNNLTRGDDGIGCVGWGPKIYTQGASVIRYNTLSVMHGNPVNWSDAGGYRLNNKDGVYYLEPSSVYTVSFKFRLLSVPLNTETLQNPKTNELSIGYGFVGGKTGNTCSGMNTVISRIFTADSVPVAEKDNATYILTTMNGDSVVNVSDEWMELTYNFATPEDMGNASPALGFFSISNYGLEYYIDDVSVTKLGSNKGMAVLYDEYTGTTSILTGEIDSEIELPDPSLNGSEHEFKGWFKDKERTEAADGIKFTNGIIKLYSAWKAPVSVTFIDTLNGGEPSVVTGVAGEEIVYPADPVDEQNEPDSQWFMGWYTTEKYTDKFTKTEFGYANYTVYSKWEGERSTFAEDFENYTSDFRTTEVNSDGIRYANRYVFGVAMEKIDDPTGNNKGKIAGLNWHGGITLDPEDPSTYRSHDRYKHPADNVMILDKLVLAEGITYTVEFDYYAKTISDTQTVSIQPVAGKAGSIWGKSIYYKDTQGAELRLTSEDVSDEWKKASFSFTAEFAEPNNRCFYMLFGISENTDTVVYIDNIVLTPAQPYESVITYKHNNDYGDKIVIGNRGEKIENYIPVDGKVEFHGWFLDKEFTVPFTADTYTRNPIVVYAKWGLKPITFENYKWAYRNNPEDRFVFGEKMNIVKGKGIGADGDDYVLDFKLIGDDVKEVKANGDIVYWKHYANSSRVHIARVGTVENNKLYKISYYYRTMEDNNQQLQVNFSNCHGGTIWHNAYTDYIGSKQVIEKDSKEWTKAETYVKTDFPMPVANTLFIQAAATATKPTDGMVLHLQLDNVLVEKIEDPYIYFDGLNSKKADIVIGSAGEEISYPENPVKLGYNFVGWYLDKELTIPFTATHFNGDEELSVYAKYELSDNVLYDFEDYDLNNPEGWYIYGNGGWVSHDLTEAYSGNSAVVLDRDASNPKIFYATYAAVGYGKDNDIFRIETDRVYILTYKYYIAKPAINAATLSFTSAGNKSFHFNSTLLGAPLIIPISKEVGVWHEGTIVVDGTKLNDPTCNALFVGMTGGKDGLYYIDDVSLTRLPKGYTAYAVDNGGCKGIPSYVMGPIGSSFANRLPVAPKLDNHFFAGYSYFDAYNNLAVLKREDMKFSEDTIRIISNFVRINTLQDFENGYEKLLGSYGNYTTIDFDWEFYDSIKEGNSKDNVTSGKFSLHRKGKSRYFENAQILTQDKTLTINERYNVTMNVKLVKSFHKDGAIKIASNNNAFYPWATTGDYLAVAAIKDLKEGEWQEINFTFIATEPYLSVQTPGYVDLFIDDINITRVDSSTELSKPVTFNEYVPLLRDADGNVLNQSVWSDETFLLVDGETQEGISLFAIIAIGGAAIVLIVLAVTVFVIKKKKNNERTVK